MAKPKLKDECEHKEAWTQCLKCGDNVNQDYIPIAEVEKIIDAWIHLKGQPRGFVESVGLFDI